MSGIKADGILGLSPNELKSEDGSPVPDNAIMKFYESGSI